MTPVTGLDYSNLSRFDQSIAASSARPRFAIYVATAVAVVLAWLWLVFQTAGLSSTSQGQSLGPGMWFAAPVLQWLSEHMGQSPLLDALIRLCTPQSANGSLPSAFVTTFAMWVAMSVAMMLPSAAPMLRTYADIAHVARGKGDTTVPLYVLALGYLSVWFGFAAVASIAQLILVRFSVVQDVSFPVLGALGGAVLILAGGYQFSALKHACLEKCRNPFTTLFANWSGETAAIYRLGIGQGVFCVGCCWALMLVMLVVGTMNLAWMAFFTLFAIVEKSGSGKVTSRLSGVILIAWGGILLISSIVVSV